MTFYKSYLIEYRRVIAGIILESRELLPATKSKDGFAVEAYYNSEIEKVTDDVITYKMETVSGNLAAYFSILVTGSVAAQYQLFIRPAFVQFSGAISDFINNFITSNEWATDILQGELKD